MCFSNQRYQNCKHRFINNRDMAEKLATGSRHLPGEPLFFTVYHHILCRISAVFNPILTNLERLDE